MLKWNKCGFAEDASIKVVRSSGLSTEQGTMIVAFYKQAPLLLDDCLYVLHTTIPSSRRSTLYIVVCYDIGVSLLPNMETDKSSKKTPHPVDLLYLDIVEVQTAEGKLSPLAALERN